MPVIAERNRVGVIDAASLNVDVIPGSTPCNLRGFKDFVPGGEMFSASDHGTKVLSHHGYQSTRQDDGLCPRGGILALSLGGRGQRVPRGGGLLGAGHRVC